MRTSTSVSMGLSVGLLLAAPALAGDPVVTWHAPTRFLKGLPYEVRVEISAPHDGARVATWVLTPSAFTLDGRPVEERRGSEVIALAPGCQLTLEYDLGQQIETSDAFRGKDFDLDFAKEYLETSSVHVKVYDPAPEDIDFTIVPVPELGQYLVWMETSRGAMMFEFFPDVAPMHARNFLDLCHTGFYEGTLFHRVKPGFMIQGGCPNTKGDDVLKWGQGSGPRRVLAEFSDLKHERGVLSMARLGHDVNSATSQFFVMHARYPSLDGQYSVFGRMITGDQVLEALVNAPGKPLGDGTTRPSEPLRIEQAIVVKPVQPGD